MRRARTLAAALTALAVSFNTTGAAAGFGHFLDEDEIAIGFEGSKPGKLENIRWDLNAVRLSTARIRTAKALALIMAASATNAFGVGRLPFHGAGEFSFAMTLGFLTSVGLTTNSLVALEVDIPFNSNPLLFFLLKAKPQGEDLQITASNQAGPIGTPVVLTDTRLARLRIQQTATDLIFDARNIRGGSWQNVATIANPVSSLLFQLSFGAAFLNPGALATFDNLDASGDIFGPAETFHLGVLYGLLATLETARSALIHDSNAALVLATMLTLQTALAATAAGIDADFVQGQFFALTQVALALKHLRSASREAGKVEKPLTRGAYVDALERVVNTVAFIQLATLALRGMGARKIADLCFFESKGHHDFAAVLAPYTP